MGGRIGGCVFVEKTSWGEDVKAFFVGTCESFFTFEDSGVNWENGGVVL
jgi:hypothetical protein